MEVMELPTVQAPNSSSEWDLFCFILYRGNIARSYVNLFSAACQSRAVLHTEDAAGVFWRMAEVRADTQQSCSTAQLHPVYHRGKKSYK